jgi:hypothetical protein
MSPYTEPTLNASVTHWQAERDGLLDEIVYLRDKLRRATNMVEDLVVAYTESASEVAFDMTEVMLVLVETRIDSEIRRFAGPETPVVRSNVPETKEDQQ